MTRRILIAEDDPNFSRVLRLLVEGMELEVRTCATVAAARAALAGAGFDLVVTDLKLPDGDGLEVLRLARQANPDLPVLMITAFATVETAVRALKEGAFDYLTKPFENDRFKAVIANALRLRELAAENLRLRREVEARIGLEAIVGASPQMAKVRELIRLAAASDVAVMIQGETGTGKELVARAIHHQSARKDRPFVAVNCGAIPEGLVEAELFGHKKGAFTGAVADRDGRFQQADSGTLLLDEVTEMQREAQVKLLRAIEAREVQPVGSVETVRVDVRVVSATNRDLKACVQEGALREDLYYRLNVFAIPLPPLRERREDIPELVADYLSRRGYGPDRVSAEALALLAEHDFPGNVRELQNVLESALILSRSHTIQPEHLADRLMPSLAPAAATGAAEVPRLADAEASLLEAALRKTGGNKSQAARLLGISRATLLYRLTKHGLS